MQQTVFVWVCELQTPKPEHGCKIKTEGFFGQELDILRGQVMIVLIVKKKLKILWQISLKIYVFKFDTLFNIGIFSVEISQWKLLNLVVEVHL